MNKDNDKAFHEYKKNYQQFNNFQVKFFNATAASFNYAIRLHYLSGVSCDQDIHNGYKKIVEALKLGLASYCIERKILDEALKQLNKVGQPQNKEISAKKAKLTKDVLITKF
ncbi:24409_t:CDS:2 [Gigaspora margarita]|uniref:24409_t:CDS:1 n=1 Tax=Gigaspora margarita TaxID=4874 RepID=A0ABN7UNS6_GIGMA|nr:24409_t:CDS:2 [Gigaspora margarita]